MTLHDGSFDRAGLTPRYGEDGRRHAGRPQYEAAHIRDQPGRYLSVQQVVLLNLVLLM
jgi:hypothetical protein